MNKEYCKYCDYCSENSEGYCECRHFGEPIRIHEPESSYCTEWKEKEGGE